MNADRAHAQSIKQRLSLTLPVPPQVVIARPKRPRRPYLKSLSVPPSVLLSGSVALQPRAPRETKALVVGLERISPTRRLDSNARSQSTDLYEGNTKR